MKDTDQTVRKNFIYPINQLEGFFVQPFQRMVIQRSL